MAIASESKKNNPENLKINPENFKISEENQENIITPENLEARSEKREESLDTRKKADKTEVKIREEAEINTISGQALSFHKRRSQEIDKILAEGLHEIFLKLNPKKQQEFKLAGEETVEKINSLLDKTKIKIGKIINLIKKWLKIIPGINQFFLEQEAKIKADKIINLKDKV